MIKTVWRCDMLNKEYKIQPIPVVRNKYHIISFIYDDNDIQNVIDFCGKCKKNLYKCLTDVIRQEDN